MPIKKAHRTRLVTALLGAALASVALPAVASAAECPVESVSQPFAALGDNNDYFLAPGGDFESTLTWSVENDYAITDSDRPDGFGGRRALKLFNGAVATSPAFCVDVTRVHVRLGALAGDKGPASQLTVEAIPENGIPVLLGALKGRDYATWTYSPFVSLAPALGLLAGDVQQTKLRLTARGRSWVVDAVAVDPRRGA
jgi:hypothetical protein